MPPCSGTSQGVSLSSNPVIGGVPLLRRIVLSGYNFPDFPSHSLPDISMLRRVLGTAPCTCCCPARHPRCYTSCLGTAGPWAEGCWFPFSLSATLLLFDSGSSSQLHPRIYCAKTLACVFIVRVLYLLATLCLQGSQCGPLPVAQLAPFRLLTLTRLTSSFGTPCASQRGLIG